MKACSYCGRDNDDDARNCRECGTEFSGAPALGKSVELVSPSNEADIRIPEIEMGFEVVEGFSRPNWKAIHQFVKGNVPVDRKKAAWHFIGEKWLLRLAKDMGGPSQVYRSTNFLCLSDLDVETVRTMVLFAESAMRRIRNYLGKAAWTGYFGRNVLLLFSDFDDYFKYISYYYPDGNHALSWGVLLSKGYVHIAVPYTNTNAAESVITHELVHNLLCHLPIPNWLNEGLAVAISEQPSNRRFQLDGELVDRHRRFWNESSIQDFWTGKAFHLPGEPSELSYSLADILVKLTSEKGLDLIKFIMAANRQDAGQQAALETLHCGIADLAAEFLGPGNWAPRKETLAEFFRKET